MTITFKVQPGPRNAYTDERGLRHYKWKDIPYPSVTTVRRMAGLPYGLHEWAIGKVTTRAVEAYGELGKILAPGTDEAIKAARSWLRSASIEEATGSIDRDPGPRCSRRGQADHLGRRRRRPVPPAVPDWLRLAGEHPGCRAAGLEPEGRVRRRSTCSAPSRTARPDRRPEDRQGTYAEHALQCCGRDGRVHRS